jgi:hypothetical protein
VTGFLARLVARAGGVEASLEPRLRHRFADRPTFAAQPDALPDPVIAESIVEDPAIADHRVAPTVAAEPLPAEDGIERDVRARLLQVETLPAVQSNPASEGDPLLMPLIETAASAGRQPGGGSPAAINGDYGDDGPAAASGDYRDDIGEDGPVERPQHHDAIGRRGVTRRERRWAAGPAMPRLAARGIAAAEDAPTVVVRIGRIDVRAVAAAASPAPAAAPKSRLQPPSLDAYLQRRERRSG